MEFTVEQRIAIECIALELVLSCGEHAVVFAKHQALKASGQNQPLKAEVWRVVAEMADQKNAAEEGGGRTRHVASGKRRRRSAA